MKKIVENFGGIKAMFNAIAFIATAVLTEIGLYCIDEVWYYEDASTIVWVAGMILAVISIRKIGESIQEEKEINKK